MLEERSEGALIAEPGRAAAARVDKPLLADDRGVPSLHGPFLARGGNTAWEPTIGGELPTRQRLVGNQTIESRDSEGLIGECEKTDFRPWRGLQQI